MRRVVTYCTDDINHGQNQKDTKMTKCIECGVLTDTEMCANCRYDEATMAVASGEWECPESDQSTRLGLCKTCGEEVTIVCAGMTHGDQELYTCISCGREDMNGDDCRLQGLEEEEIEVW